ncbi:NAD(P)H-binding protein, partial [Mammaliicoccus sciuri]
MKIFVIGANGQIGRHLVKDLVAEGNEVVAGIRKNSQ